MNLFKNIKFFYITIILISIIIGIISISIMPAFPFSDEAKYDKIATELINNQTYPIIKGMLISPGYPFLLALIYKIFGHNYNIVYFIQFLILGFTGIFIFKIGKEFFNFSKIQALFLSLIIICWPYLILYSNLLRTEMLFTFFLTLGVWQLLNLTKNNNIKNNIILGVILTAGTLTRPILLLLPFWIIFFIFIYQLIKNKNLKNDDKQKLFTKKQIRNVIIILTLFIVLLTPWIYFSSKKTGKLTPVASNIKNVYSKANKSFGYERKTYKNPDFKIGAKITPKKIIISKLKNVYRFWKSGAEGYQAEMLIKKIPVTKYLISLYRILFYIMLFTAFCSIYFIKKKEIFLLWLIITYFWGVHSVLFPYPRYTLPIIPLVLLLSIYTIINHKKLLKRNENISIHSS